MIGNRLGPAATLAAVCVGILATGYGLDAAMNWRKAAREWLSYVVFALPTVGLAGAGWLGRTTPRRWVVTVAGVVCLVANLVLLVRVVGVSGVIGQNSALVPLWLLGVTWVTALPASVAAVVAAAVGWRQRGHERLTDDADPAGG